MKRHAMVGSSRYWILAGLTAFAGSALAGCSGAPDAGEEDVGEAELAATVCVTIQRGVGNSVVKDAFLHAGQPAANYGTGPDMYSGLHSSGASQYALLHFDLSVIPANATVVSADLTLNIGSAYADVVRFHKVTSAWAENTVNWSSHSAASDPAVEGTYTAGIYGNRTFSVLAPVQSWVNGAANHGLLFEQTANRTQMKTSEATQAQRPMLVVCYDDGTGAASSSTATTTTTTTTTSTTTGTGGAGGSGGAGGGGAGGSGGGGGNPGAPPSCEAGGPGAGNNCGPSNEDCCATAEVPGGTFNRLNSASYPATVSTFHLDKYNVTVGRFRRWLEVTGGATQANPPAAGSGAHPLIPNSGWYAGWNSMLATDTAALKQALVCDPYGWPTYTPTPGAKENKPIVCASFLELFAFCAWDGGRLPTQAEMNYAAAGGSEQRLYPWITPGEPNDVTNIQLTDASWCCQGDGSVAGDCINSYPSLYPCSQNDITNVGNFPNGAGRWGHHDLAGNVYKATRDGSDNYNPLVPCNNCSRLDNTSTGRVMHGGSFLAAAYKQTTTFRAGYGTNARRYYISVSCARDL